MKFPVYILAIFVSLGLSVAQLQPIPRTETAALSHTSALPLVPTSTLSTPAQITEAPEFDLEGVSLKEKWHLTTYTTCVTLGSYIGCGVHEPVLPGGDEISGAGDGRWKPRGWMWGVVVAGVGVLLL